MLKIIAGEFRSRALQSPPDAELTRPYTARARESVFNVLRGWFEGANVLDLFAGVGTMGLEAVSRGAQRVLMVEQNRKIHRMLEENIRELGCKGRATAMLGDALAMTPLHRAPQPVDIVFMDPPYRLMLDESSRRRVLDQAARCREIMAEQSFLVLRSPVDDPDAMAIAGFDGPEVHRHRKDMFVLFYHPIHESGPEKHPGTAADTSQRRAIDSAADG